MGYKHSPPPKEELTTKELLNYLVNELFRLEAELSQIREGYPDERRGDSPRPREGQLRWADGDAWNPTALGPGHYTRVNGVWNKIVTLNELGQLDSLLGAGVTPEAWTDAIGDGVLQFGARGAISALGGGISVTLSLNAYNDGAWKYIEAGAAALINLSSAGHFIIYTAPAGAADATISFTERFQVSNTGAVTAGGSIKSSGTGGVGYSTGAGGTVTQATSKATGVTLNKICGEITMNGAALAAAAIVSFTLTNSAIAAGDLLLLNHVSVGTIGAYGLNAVCNNGSAVIYVRNNTAGSLSQAIVLRFAVIKGVTA